MQDPAFVRIAPAQFALREFHPDMSEPDLQPKMSREEKKALSAEQQREEENQKFWLAAQKEAVGA